METKGRGTGSDSERELSPTLKTGQPRLSATECTSREPENRMLVRATTLNCRRPGSALCAAMHAGYLKHRRGLVLVLPCGDVEMAPSGVGVGETAWDATRALPRIGPSLTALGRWMAFSNALLHPRAVSTRGARGSCVAPAGQEARGWLTVGLMVLTAISRPGQ